MMSAESESKQKSSWRIIVCGVVSVTSFISYKSFHLMLYEKYFYVRPQCCLKSCFHYVVKALPLPLGIFLRITQVRRLLW